MLKLPAVYPNPMPMLGPSYARNGHQKNIIDMNGRQVFRFATRVISDAVQDVLEKAEMSIEDVALIVPHQANVRIIESAAKRLKISPDKFFMNVGRTGNTSAASIPIALCDAIVAGRLHPDDNVVFVGFGGGLTWAASVVKWDVTPQEVSLLDREWKRARYIAARGRSRIRKIGRQIGARLAGSPTPEARIRDADKQ